jgi:tetratricopeptide (TPR) repeat protein
MRRWIWTAVLAGAALPALPAQQGELKQRQQKQEQPKPGAKQELPPEEDLDLANVEYSFNPLQAEKDLNVGNYYFKLGKYRAAEGRFRTATKWNEGYADAWLRLGEVSEKLKDPKGAREAYQKYLEFAADAKNAPEVRKRLGKLK